MMGSSMLLAASRQSFAFARDGALPFSSVLYRMNGYTKTPVNTVWFCAFFATLMGLLAFAGAQAINAVFSISVIALYVAYAIPITARWVFENEFKPGPFYLGWFVSGDRTPRRFVHRTGCVVDLIVLAELPMCGYFGTLDGVHGRRLPLPHHAPDICSGHELQRCRPRRHPRPFCFVVLLPRTLPLHYKNIYLLNDYINQVYGGVHWFTGPIPNVEKAKGVDSASRMSGGAYVGRTSDSNEDGDSMKEGKEDVNVNLVST